MADLPVLSPMADVITQQQPQAVPPELPISPTSVQNGIHWTVGTAFATIGIFLLAGLFGKGQCCSATGLAWQLLHGRVFPPK